MYDLSYTAGSMNTMDFLKWLSVDESSAMNSTVREMTGRDPRSVMADVRRLAESAALHPSSLVTLTRATKWYDGKPTRGRAWKRGPALVDFLKEPAT